MQTTLTNEDYDALRFRAMRMAPLAQDRGQLAGNHGDTTDYRAMLARMPARDSEERQSLAEIVWLEVCEGITWREWCEWCQQSTEARP